MENTTELNWIPFNDSSYFAFSYPLAVSALSAVSQLKAANLHPALPTIGTVSQQKTVTTLRSVPMVSTVSQKKAAVLHSAVAAAFSVTQQKAIIRRSSAIMVAVLSQLKAVTLRTHDSLAYWYEFNNSAFNIWGSTSAPDSLRISSTVTQKKAVNLHPLRTAPSVVTVRKSSTLHPTVAVASTISQKKAINLHPTVFATSLLSTLKAITLHTRDTLVYWFEFDYAPFNTWNGVSTPSSLSAHNSVNQAKSINLHPRLSATSTILSIKAIVRKASIAIPLVIDHIWTIWPERALAILSTITLRKIVNLHLINSPHSWAEFNEDSFNVFNVSPGASLSALSTISQTKAVDLHMPIIPVVSTISSEKKVLRGFSLATSGIVSILKNIGAKRLIAAASTISQKKAVELQQEVAASVTVAQVKAVTLRQELTATSIPTVQKSVSRRILVAALATVSQIKSVNLHPVRTIATTVSTYILVRWPGLKAKARIETLKGKVRK